MPAKHEVHRAKDAERGPEIVEAERLLHAEEGERNEHHEGDRLLHLELSE
jgi:hypothetical protein